MTKAIDAIEIKNIRKRFGTYEVFKDLSLHVNPGTITYVLGPSGVGKSVLLKHILGLLKPDAGEVSIFGQPIPYGDAQKINQMRENFGMLFQSAALFDDLTVFQNVAFPLVEHRRDMSASAMRTKVTEKLLAVGLDPKETLDKFPNQLSGGMKKRVGLARAIVLEPKILLYDEPTTGLDPVTRAMVDDLIVSTNKKFVLTSLVISHDILSALHHADTVAFLFGGKIVFRGTAEEFKHCEHPVVQSFLKAEKRHLADVG